MAHKSARFRLMETAFFAMTLCMVLLTGWAEAKTLAAKGPDSAGGAMAMIKINKSDNEWKKQLDPEQYRVTRCSATEPPFTGKYWNNHARGEYRCIGCGLPLFLSETKFESGTGWPSFYAPIKPENITSIPDNSSGMIRTEIVCPCCGAHLGHVFEDGPQPTGLRYCVNSASLDFIPAATAQVSEKQATAAFAAGCFWGIEDAFSRVKGVLSTAVGYMGGHTRNPTYEQVCTDRTGHAETVLITYNPALVSYDHLLEVFWKIHDPTTPNRQGPDVGSQYRSVIFYYSQDQKKAAQESIKKLSKDIVFRNSIVTEVVPKSDFWPAEEYHQKYVQKHGSHGCRIPDIH